MDSGFKQSVIKWHSKYNERQKLQHVYMVIVAISFVVASLISLVDAHVGRRILFVTVAALGIFLINTVIWSILYSSLLVDLKPKRIK